MSSVEMAPPKTLAEEARSLVEDHEELDREATEAALRDRLRAVLAGGK